MPRRNTLVFIIVLIIFALALSIVLPINEGILGKRGIRLGLDLQGGIHVVYKADLSSVEQDDWDSAIEGVKRETHYEGRLRLRPHLSQT